MSNKLQQKELDILRIAVDKAEKIQQRQIINNPDVKRIIGIVEKFIIDTSIDGSSGGTGKTFDWSLLESNGILSNILKNKDYLQGQLGNPEGDDVPNKKYYDPRVWLREGQTSLVDRVKQSFSDLNAIDVF